ncbi:uncharacterized protein LOC143297281 [Babylonia areolata]|uniref:uncharacterized protein LOC143297281 n=1 Tax=Babylonia areolata TaxID=304850 RepID=UPI003FD39838
MTMKKCLKVFLTSILFTGGLLLMTAEKTSFVWTLRVIRNPDISLPAWYAALTVLLVSPYLLALLQIVWNVSFLTKCSDTRLPPLCSVLTGVVGSIMEGACMVWVSSLLVPYIPVFVVLPALGCVLPLSSLSPTLTYLHDPYSKLTETSVQTRGEKSHCGRGKLCMSVLCCVSPILAALTLAVSGCLHWLSAMLMPLCLLLLALMWSPTLRHRTFSVNGNVTHNCRRLKFMYTFIKLLSVLGFIFVDMLASSTVQLSVQGTLLSFCQGFYGLRDESLLIPLLMNMTTGLLSHALAYLSLAMCQPLMGMVLPSVLSTVTSTVLCVGVLGPYVYHTDELGDFGDPVPVLASGGVLACAWAISHVLRACDALKKPKFLFMPYDDLLLGYGWCPGFSDLQRLLYYCADGVSHDRLIGQHTGTKSRVYVCTTMYREADYEMERLLFSIKKLSGSDKLKGVYLEAHIFMDNGINDGQLGDFAEQLFGLLVNRIGMDPGEARCLMTPYGLQLTYVLPGGMPLFVHFKDPLKIKPKKRWSQCMYIKYIMDFRKALWTRDNDSSNLQPLPKGDPDVYFIDSECSWSKLDTAVLPCTQTNFTKQFHSPEHKETGASSVSNGSVATEVRTANGAHSPVLPCSDRGPDEQQVPCQAPDPTRGGAFHFDPAEQVDDDHTYILATDADMDFEPEAIAELLHMCNFDKRIGAACGRTHPIGKHFSTIVCHQIFEYAKDFWMIKSGQNVIGSVMCCPGCFSLYRARALRQVMDTYATPTTSPFSVYVKDTGEDRWMATLMMINGWRLRYNAFADNTTYCPDTFEEFFKQRRRWILSDMANLILVVQNMPRLLRNNDCFTLVYVIYLFNMFMNNVIIPGTAIVMITAGMELVFGIPYVYTTPALTTVVYAYAFLCTRSSTHVQTLATSLLTLVLGTAFTCVAVWGSYLIVGGMASEIRQGAFQFQQHYVILMLALSLLYAALIHPREMYQMMYGLAYLFIFPAMHLLLPIYSIANIVDQSWGTRDSQTAKIPKMKCIPRLMKLVKRRNKNKEQAPSTTDDNNGEIQRMVTSMTQVMADGSDLEQVEHKFWEDLRHSLLANDVNVGLERAELAHCLERLRDRSLLGLLSVNVLWLAVLSYFYVGIDSPISRLNLYGIISGALYGFTLIIQVIGMTVSRVHHILIKLARYLYGDQIPMWICLDDRKPL